MLQLDIGQKTAKIKVDEATALEKMAIAEAQQIENQIVTSGFENLVSDRNADSVGKHLDNIQKQVETMKLAQEPNVSASVSV